MSVLSIFAAIQSIENERQRVFVENLYKKYSPWVLGYAYQIVRNYDAAQDILNESFIRIIMYVDQIMELEEYKRNAYVKRIISSVSMNYLEKESGETKKAELWKIISHNEVYNEYSVDTLLERMDLEEILNNAMNELDERDRTLLIYKYSFDMSYKQISEEMKIPLGNVGAYVKRAKSRFVKVMKKDKK